MTPNRYSSLSLQARLFAALLLALVAVVGDARSARAQASAQVAPPRVVVLLASEAGQDRYATFGAEGVDGGDALRLLRAPFEAAGMPIASAAGLSPSITEAPQGLPLGDAAASELGKRAGASLVVIAGVIGANPTHVRATQLMGQEVSVRVRVLDLQAQNVLYDASETASGYGADLSQALLAASQKAITKLSRPLPSMLAQRYGRRDEGDAIEIVITGAPGWRPVASVFQKLAATRGIQAVHLQQLNVQRVVLRVHSQQSAASLVAALRRTRIVGGTISAQSAGQSISVSIQMNAPTTPVLNG